MSRVWKRFLFKVFKGVAVISYLLGVMLGSGFVSVWLGYPFEPGVLVGAVLFIAGPMVSYVLYDLYRDAKQEIEWENRKMMNTLKGNNHDL